MTRQLLWGAPGRTLWRACQIDKTPDEITNKISISGPGTPNSVARNMTRDKRLASASSLCEDRVQDLLDRFSVEAAAQDPFVWLSV